MNREFWKDRRVLLTGHTGFKGAWAAAMLHQLGASVTGIALAPEDDLALWPLIAERVPVAGHITDLRDAAAIAEIVRKAAPEIAIHMAAQAQVRRGYRDPVETYSTNLMGTVNLLEALRRQDGLKAVLVVTSDKVYRNAEKSHRFREDDPLGGSDPYSASKAACELLARSYAESFFSARGVPLATARGGNVIGGGDWASDRLVPDIYRAAKRGVPVQLRFPSALRPWQHVLDCVDGYFCYVEHLHAKGAADPAALNFGPGRAPGLSVAALADAVGRRLGMKTPWEQAEGDAPPEKMTLALDTGLARRVLGWKSRLDSAQMIEWTAAWYASYAEGKDAFGLVESQVHRYLGKFSSVSA